MDKKNSLIGEAQERPLFELIEENKPKNRPVGLPDAAVWRGGVDGGNYFFLPSPIDGEQNIYHAEVYSDATGNLIYKGRFRHIHTEYSNCELVDFTRKDNDIFWNGEVLNLSGTGQYLLPIDTNTLDIDPHYLNELKNIEENNRCGNS